MIFEATICQQFSNRPSSWEATGEFDTKTLLFTISEEEYDKLITANKLNNIVLNGSDSMGNEQYMLFIDDKHQRKNYQLKSLSIQDLEDNFGIDFTTTKHSSEIHNTYCAEYNAKQLHDKLDTKLPSQPETKRNKI